MKRFTALLLCLVLQAYIFGEGFVAGTLVKTRTGYKEIEKLDCHDDVLCYDCTQYIPVEEKVIGIHKESIETSIRMVINGQTVEMASDQKLYVPATRQWITAQALLQNPALLQAFQQHYRVDEIQEISTEKDVYTLTVKTHHNFFITENNILVHNPVFIPPITIITLDLLTMEIILPSLAAISAAVVAALEYHVNYGRHYNNTDNGNSPITNPTPPTQNNPSPNPPDEDENDPFKIPSVPKGDFELPHNGNNFDKFKIPWKFIKEHLFHKDHNLSKLGYTEEELLRRIVEAIKYADKFSALAVGFNRIHTHIAGCKIEIRCFLQDNIIRTANAFDNFSKRPFLNVPLINVPPIP